MNKRRARFMIALMIFLIAAVLIYFHIMTADSDSYEVDHEIKRTSNLGNVSSYHGIKTILLWTSFFEDDWFYLGKTKHFDGCPRYNNCLLTRSRELIDIEQFNAVLFHGNEVKRNNLPRRRDPSQKYVFVNLESPRNRPLTNSFFENYFNLTMTYRLDSDIPWPYYLVKNIATGEVVAPLYKSVKWIEPSYDTQKLSLDLKFENKTKMAAWLVSNCWTHGKRELFVDQLQKYMQVDRIGKCSKPMNPRCVKSADRCFQQVIEPDYFFYFSFENTLCQDYVTEKLFNALSHNIIPVVYGGANYSLFAPPHSYIDALDFDSPKALADYLIELSKDKEEYMKYFWWRKFYTVNSSTKWLLCNLCEFLNVPKPPKTYSHLSNWFLKDKCPIQNLMNDHEYATKELKSRVNNKKIHLTI